MDLLKSTGLATNYFLIQDRQSYTSSFTLPQFESQEDRRIATARAILEEAVNDLPDNELEIYLTLFQTLIDNWLDSYERNIFNELTLKELLRER
jgi:hypothetical protein